QGGFRMSPCRGTAVLAVAFLAVAALSTVASPAAAAPKPALKAAPRSAALSRDEIRQAERWLADLGYWSGPADGAWDDVSRHALIAFQKIQHAKATGRLTRAEYNALSVATPPRPRELGAHIEVDLARQ